MWQTMDGEIHSIRCDDMGELLTCESCRGYGISERCDDCMLAEEDDDFDLHLGGM